MIIINPILPILLAQPIPTAQPFGNFIFVPGIFESVEDEHGYLSSLDSDTREYVVEHTSEFRTRADIIECVNKLHGKS